MPEHRAICAPRRVICGSRCSTLRSLDTIACLFPGKGARPLLGNVAGAQTLNEAMSTAGAVGGAPAVRWCLSVVAVLWDGCVDRGVDAGDGSAEDPGSLAGREPW